MKNILTTITRYAALLAVSFLLFFMGLYFLTIFTLAFGISYVTLALTMWASLTFVCSAAYIDVKMYFNFTEWVFGY